MYDNACLQFSRSYAAVTSVAFWRFAHQFVTISPSVSSTNGLLLPEVIKPEDIMFE
jgi:hypothetical protein